MQSRKGFTLIELLVVIAIIGILATIVTLQVAGAQVKSRNSRAQSDISQAGKAIELYKTNQETSGLIAADVTELTADEGDDFKAIFAGKEVADTSYGISITKTPSADYTYKYLTDNEATASKYCVGTNAKNVGSTTVTGFMVVDGASKDAANPPVFTAGNTSTMSCS